MDGFSEESDLYGACVTLPSSEIMPSLNETWPSYCDGSDSVTGLSVGTLSPSSLYSDEILQAISGDDILMPDEQPTSPGFGDSVASTATYDGCRPNSSMSFYYNKCQVLDVGKSVTVGNGEILNLTPSSSQDDNNHNEDGNDIRRTYSLGNSFSKNAIAARDNRLKKKKYVANLEETVRKLSAENAKLSEEAEESREAVKLLEREVSYMKSVVANQSTLSAILKSVKKTPGIKLSTSFGSSLKYNNKGNKKRPKANTSSTGSANACIQADVEEHLHLESTESMSILSSKATLSCDSRRSTRQSIRSQKNYIECQNEKQGKNHHENECAVDVDDSDSTLSTSVSSDRMDPDEGGVCFHVSGKNVSLEFCSHCSSSAGSGAMSDHSYVKH